MAAKTTKKVSQTKFDREKDYLLHLVLFILGIVAGLLYYKIFLVGYY